MALERVERLREFKKELEKHIAVDVLRKLIPVIEANKEYNKKESSNLLEKLKTQEDGLKKLTIMAEEVRRSSNNNLGATILRSHKYGEGIEEFINLFLQEKSRELKSDFEGLLLEIKPMIDPDNKSPKKKYNYPEDLSIIHFAVEQILKYVANSESTKDKEPQETLLLLNIFIAINHLNDGLEYFANNFLEKTEDNIKLLTKNLIELFIELSNWIFNEFPRDKYNIPDGIELAILDKIAKGCKQINKFTLDERYKGNLASIHQLGVVRSNKFLNRELSTLLPKPIAEVLSSLKEVTSSSSSDSNRIEDLNACLVSIQGKLKEPSFENLSNNEKLVVHILYLTKTIRIIKEIVALELEKTKSTPEEILKKLLGDQTVYKYIIDNIKAELDLIVTYTDLYDFTRFCDGLNILYNRIVSNDNPLSTQQDHITKSRIALNLFQEVDNFFNNYCQKVRDNRKDGVLVSIKEFGIYWNILLDKFSSDLWVFRLEVEESRELFLGHFSEIKRESEKPTEKTVKYSARKLLIEEGRDAAKNQRTQRKNQKRRQKSKETAAQAAQVKHEEKVKQKQEEETQQAEARAADPDRDKTADEIAAEGNSRVDLEAAKDAFLEKLPKLLPNKEYFMTGDEQKFGVSNKGREIKIKTFNHTQKEDFLKKLHEEAKDIAKKFEPDLEEGFCTEGNKFLATYYFNLAQSLCDSLKLLTENQQKEHQKKEPQTYFNLLFCISEGGIFKDINKFLNKSSEYAKNNNCENEIEVQSIRDNIPQQKENAKKLQKNLLGKVKEYYQEEQAAREKKLADAAERRKKEGNNTVAPNAPNPKTLLFQKMREMINDLAEKLGETPLPAATTHAKTRNDDSEYRQVRDNTPEFETGGQEANSSSATPPGSAENSVSRDEVEESEPVDVVSAAPAEPDLLNNYQEEPTHAEHPYVMAQDVMNPHQTYPSIMQPFPQLPPMMFPYGQPFTYAMGPQFMPSMFPGIMPGLPPQNGLMSGFSAQEPEQQPEADQLTAEQKEALVESRLADMQKKQVGNGETPPLIPGTEVNISGIKYKIIAGPDRVGGVNFVEVNPRHTSANQSGEETRPEPRERKPLTITDSASGRPVVITSVTASSASAAANTGSGGEIDKGGPGALDAATASSMGPDRNFRCSDD